MFGVASADGRVLLGTDGWRAEIARPLALLWGAAIELDDRAALTTHRYAVPTYRDVSALVQEWGPDEVERELAKAAS